MKKIARILTLLTALALVASLFAGCGGTSSGSASSGGPASTEAVQTAAPTQAVTEAPAEETESWDSGVIHDLSACGDELSIWIALLMSIENNTESVNELTAIQAYAEKTGVDINWEQATMAGAVEQFNVMCVSGEYPDIILSFDNYYNGGATGGYEEGIILKLNDYIEEYMPNYYAQISADEALKKNVVTDSGDYLGVYGFYDSDYYPLSGPMVRNDWLTALDMDVPVTYDDYYDLALAFKTEYGCTDPILMLGDGTFYAGMGYMVGYFSGGLGTPGFSAVGTGRGALGLYQENGTVKSSLTEAGYKAYLQMLSAWYEAGVISRDFATHPTSQMTPDFSSFIYNSQTGVFIGDAVNMLGYAANAVDAGFELVGAPDPVVKAGDAATPFGINRNRQQGSGAAVSTGCENVELAMRWLDQWFSDEGAILSNYGVQGLAHEVGADGVRRYTDIVLHNETLSQQAATVLYTVIFVPTVNTQQNRFALWTDTPVVMDAVNTWYDSTTTQNALPNVSLSPEESATYAGLAATIQTYAAENVAKFINGEKPFDEWDDFTAQAEELGIDDCIAAYQSALDRYNQR